MVLAAAGVALVVGLLSQPGVLSDDAAINLRYAARAADGRGLTWNDHEAVQGFSNPLHQLLLAGGSMGGADPVELAEALALFGLCTTAALAAELALRLRGPGAAVLTVALLLGPAFWVAQVWTGLEVGLAAALGLALVRAAVARRAAWCAAVAALVVLAKLDGWMIVLAVTVSWSWIDRRPRWAPLAGAGAATAGWTLVAWLAYGAPLPRSLTSKLGGGQPFDSWWPVDAVGGRWLLPVLVLAALGTALLVRQRGPVAVGGLALAGWGTAALIAAAAVDLGDHHPWYVAPALAPATVLAGVGGAWGLHALRRRAGPAWQTVAAVGATVLVAVALVRSGDELVARVVEDEQPDYLLLEEDRRQAGRLVAALAEPGEVVKSCFGWVAYEARNQPVHDPCGLNSVEAPGPTTWLVLTGDEPRGDARIPVVPDGFRAVAVADEACTERTGLTWYVVAVASGTPADLRSGSVSTPC